MAVKLFHELLGLGLNREVVESRFERESITAFLEIRETARLWELARCPANGGLAFCRDHTEVQTWRHLNIFQHRCETACRPPQGRCRQAPPAPILIPPKTAKNHSFSLFALRVKGLSCCRRD